jgi:hypothetical protein
LFSFTHVLLPHLGKPHIIFIVFIFLPPILIARNFYLAQRPILAICRLL